ncbi:MAG: hypothetical protein ACLPWS_01545 [Rhodomicrobium sp.]
MSFVRFLGNPEAADAVLGDISVFLLFGLDNDILAEDKERRNERKSHSGDREVSSASFVELWDVINPIAGIKIVPHDWSPWQFSPYFRRKHRAGCLQAGKGAAELALPQSMSVQV